MAYSPDTDKTAPQQIGHTVAEISEKASLLVREEIELAKAEVGRKVKTLSKGAAVAAAAGVFAVLGLILLLHAVAWLFAWVFGSETLDIFWGHLVTAGILFLLAAIAGLLGVRWIKRGAPPTPDMAIDEAKRIRETVSS
ncbi:MAG TPA: phage holin family protein [Solirubrobacteraceae bacterium]|jgi:H+/Cl- antiporter ClcA|nr:phage holin family protein [Solirubrobacteraceae bacterium]